MLSTTWGTSLPWVQPQDVLLQGCESQDILHGQSVSVIFLALKVTRIFILPNRVSLKDFVIKQCIEDESCQ